MRIIEVNDAPINTEYIPLSVRCTYASKIISITKQPYKKKKSVFMHYISDKINNKSVCEKEKTNNDQKYDIKKIKFFKKDKG